MPEKNIVLDTVLQIVNKKTVFGLKNTFDDDKTTENECNQRNENVDAESLEYQIRNENIDITTLPIVLNEDLGSKLNFA